MDSHAFITTYQKPHKTVQSYLATLKTLAAKCKFGTLHDELIRDRLVCGINNDNIHTQLLNGNEEMKVKFVLCSFLHALTVGANIHLTAEAVQLSKNATIHVENGTTFLNAVDQVEQRRTRYISVKQSSPPHMQGRTDTQNKLT